MLFYFYLNRDYSIELKTVGVKFTGHIETDVVQLWIRIAKVDNLNLSIIFMFGYRLPVVIVHQQSLIVYEHHRMT